MLGNVIILALGRDKERMGTAADEFVNRVSLPLYSICPRKTLCRERGLVDVKFKRGF